MKEVGGGRYTAFAEGWVMLRGSPQKLADQLALHHSLRLEGEGSGKGKGEQGFGDLGCWLAQHSLYGGWNGSELT